MLLIMMMSATLLILTLILMVLNLIFSKKSFFDREKASAYECGFDPLNATAESFSIQFFIISIMFLTFDIEIVMLIPMIPAIEQKSFNWILTSSTILLVLILGMAIEWSENSIKWQK